MPDSRGLERLGELAPMCGIVGAVAVGERGIGDAELELMSHAVRRRGPDDSGSWVHDARFAGFGHRRLSIIDTSEAGHQPMFSSCGRYVLALNGEIYNFPELRERLTALGRRFRGHCDAEVFLESISEWGPESAVNEANGMFAFALWDLEHDTLRLGRDRLGEKPLYFGWATDAFVFGSQLSALEQHPGFPRNVDKDALNAFLRYAYVPTPMSIYSGSGKLPAGTTLTVSHSMLRDRPSIADLLGQARRYWSPRGAWLEHHDSGTSIDDSQLADELDRRLSSSVSTRMISDVPIGAFLSGGIDSSTIVALMQRASGVPVKTFSIGYDDRSRDEAQDARRIAEHLGTEHSGLRVTPDDVLRLIPELPAIYDEPFADSSQLPTTIVSRLARESVKVVLTGDGGDEVFGGYNRYVWAPLVWSRISRLPDAARRLAGSGLTRFSPTAWDHVFRRLGGILPARWSARTPGDKLHKLARALRADSPDALYHELCSQWRDEDGLLVGCAPIPAPELSNAGPTSFAEQMMLVDMERYLADDILTKVDRASMSTGLEARVPFLDHELIEFAMSMPMASKIRGRTGKWILREVLHRYVPPALVDRPKMGFGVPIHDWLRGPLRQWAGDLLSADRLRREGFLRPEPVQRLLRQHLDGTHNWQGPLWTVLMFQSWLARDRGSSAVIAETARSADAVHPSD